MYLKYCLIANIAICILSLIIFYALKRKNLTSIKNTYTLVFCTVLAMIGVSLVPLIAGYLVEILSISILESLIVSILSLIIFTLAVFYFSFSILIRQAEKIEEKKSERIAEKLLEDSAKAKHEVGETVKQNGYTEKIEDFDISKEYYSEINVDYLSTGKSEEEEQIAAEEEEQQIVAEEEEQQIVAEEEEQQIVAEEDQQIVAEEEDQQIIPEDEKENIADGQEYDKPVFIDIPEYNTNKQSDIFELLDIAMENKLNRNYHDAIKAYESALILNTDDELCYLIILDLCSLYKMTGNIEAVYKLLDSNQCNLLNTDIKKDILRNIIIY